MKPKYSVTYFLYLLSRVVLCEVERTVLFRVVCLRWEDPVRGAVTAFGVDKEKLPLFVL